jgi:DNA replication and repair protein RecF
MRVGRIALSGFRNYEWEAADFAPGTNVVTGENAQGKTNLLEAVYLLSGGRSFRTRLDRELVGFGFSSAEVLADVESGGRDQTIKITLIPGQRKQITVNAVKRTAAELSGVMTCVLFCPDDLDVVKEGAAARRRLLDMAISQLRPGYAALLSDYNRLLDQKTAILRDWREKPSLLDTLDDFSEQMCRVSARLIRYRAAFTARLAAAAGPIHRDFSGGRDELTLEYRTVSTVRDPFAGEKEIYYAVCDHQEAHRQAELESGQCLTGAHKDDIEISLCGRSARAFASQGQTRTAALSLKLAEREIFLAETGEWPVLLLDDVLSELDARRQEFVLNRIGGGQTIITCCEDDDISRRTGGKVFSVSGGKLREVR